MTGPAHGTLTLNPDGSFTYVPDANFNGVDTFTYQASDGTATSTPVTVTLNVGDDVTLAPGAGRDYGRHARHHRRHRLRSRRARR